MNRNNYKGLLKELKKFGFDDRIDVPLETCIRQCKPAFSFSYGTQPSLRDYEEEWLIYELHFERNIWNGTYSFVKCDVQLFRPIFIQHHTILSIQTELIEEQLQSLRLDIPNKKRTKEDHLSIDAAAESLAIISSDVQGKKIAGLLISKYWPLFEEVVSDIAIEGLVYDRETNLFFLRHSFHPSDGERLVDIEQSMMGRLDALVPKPPAYSYSLQGVGHTFNPVSRIEMGFKRQFYSLKEACTLLHGIDDMLFNQEIMAAANAPWYLRQMTIIDNNDKQPVVSKNVLNGPNEINKTTELFLLYEINDKKLSMSEFMLHRSVRSAPDADISHILSEFKNQIGIIDPTSITTQTITSDENRQARKHNIQKRFPPGTGRKL
jgi:hypothetical protein